MPQDCKNFKKVFHAKFCRFVLTESGKLFYQGQNRKYMFNSNVSRNANIDGFAETNVFSSITGDEKIVDVTGGKHFIAIVTESGRLFASGYIFYRNFRSCRHNR